MFANLLQMIEKFRDEMDCIKYFISQRWIDGVKCPHCGHNHVYHFKDGKRFKCKDCKQPFSYKTGSIFENTKIPLRKWFIAIYLESSHKKGISSLQLSKDIGTTQKTAWFMLQRIRLAMGNNTHNEFEGITEIDEAYLGGREDNRHMQDRVKGIKDKAVILGMVNRDTKQAKLIKVDSSKYYDLADEILDTVKEGETIITDEYSSYRTLGKYFYKHNTINHSKGEYVKNTKAFKIHTNTIEGVWSGLKRGINGIYHWVSKKHISMYLNEFAFRYNVRELAEGVKFNLLLQQTNTRIRYVDLIR